MINHLKRPWCGATDPAATSLLTLPQSPGHLTTHGGTQIDLLGVAPQTVGFSGRPRLTGVVTKFSTLEEVQRAAFLETKRACGRAHFSQAVPLRAVALCDELAGRWLRSSTWRTSRRRPTGQFRPTCCLHRLRAMAWTTRQPCLVQSPWTRSRCTSTARAPSRRSTGQSARPWVQGAAGRTSGAGFFAPTMRSRQSRSRAIRRRPTWRQSILLTFSAGETISQTSSQRKGQTHTSQLFALHERLWLVLPWPSKRHVGRPRPSCAAVKDLGRHESGCAERTRSVLHVRRGAHSPGCAGCSPLGGP